MAVEQVTLLPVRSTQSARRGAAAVSEPRVPICHEPRWWEAYPYIPQAAQSSPAALAHVCPQTRSWYRTDTCDATVWFLCHTEGTSACRVEARMARSSSIREWTPVVTYSNPPFETYAQSHANGFGHGLYFTWVP